MITKECIALMLEALSYGTRFEVQPSAWEGQEMGMTFKGRHYYNGKIHYIRVTNDERRRLIPLLKNLQKYPLYFI
ncbi:MAG: hypothetical protein WD512_08255 [Candidatus Paceibacterota bacterium]